MARGLSGGHSETEGISPAGKVLEVQEHAHAVEMDLTRYELSLSNTLNETWDAVLRVPWFVKEQRAEVLFQHGTSSGDRAAALLSGYNHHRSETYEGFADLELGVGWRRHHLLGQDSILRLSFGVTLPTGQTVSDPLRAGDLGLKHLHIQFGNGTVDPLLDFYLGLPLSEKWAFSVYGKGRFPLYENAHGYHGSAEGSVIPRVTWLPAKKLSLSAGLSAAVYGYAEWSGRRDPNSGQFILNSVLSAGYKLSDRMTASASLLVPLGSKSFSSEDTLEPAPIFSLSLGWVL